LLIHFGYFSQSLDLLDESETILENVMKKSTKEESFVRMLLARLLFKGNAVFKPISVLSGGEKNKVSLALLLASDANVLILDEPTNYLDIASMEAIEEALKGYEGTNPYHNFTTGKAPSDSNVKRFVVEFECDDPVVDESTGVEWVLLSVLGQSFLLNQIRKMVGLAVDIARGATSIDKISDAFSPQRLDVPMAPGQGLFLDELFFEGYNIKIDNSNNKALKLGEKRATTEVGTNHSTVTENTDDCQAGKKLKNEIKCRL
jgi:tRNA U38,U39,U40 pseudouridine synthase TruA